MHGDLQDGDIIGGADDVEVGLILLESAGCELAVAVQQLVQAAGAHRAGHALQRSRLRAQHVLCHSRKALQAGPSRCLWATRIGRQICQEGIQDGPQLPCMRVATSGMRQTWQPNRCLQCPATVQAQIKERGTFAQQHYHSAHAGSRSETGRRQESTCFDDGTDKLQQAGMTQLVSLQVIPA